MKLISTFTAQHNAVPSTAYNLSVDRDGYTACSYEAEK
ncbi:hypothetical protein APHCR_1057 [Anaplasma phagocytophilum str. CR1007]|uniref:Uncharacterized protein n=1 Tax=Anaplasma phagocytophilum str. NCH-1 TaxID=1359161 RepID=A0A0F3NN48_ANAPH|nr:hypothetical protein EPHNCH_0310 [Anaplasma phagocytophilum str. NCH-1]KJZ98364.1 hypothetical protein APHCR_1057 [Anaplasma phagocytophilum str. CR1007]KKA00509.1 hypothetical protein APHDU1_0855 [Anaplasma phagocytophilum]